MNMQAGETYVPVNPWQQAVSSRTELDVAMLSKEVQKHLELLLDEEERQNNA